MHFTIRCLKYAFFDEDTEWTLLMLYHEWLMNHCNGRLETMNATEDGFYGGLLENILFDLQQAQHAMDAAEEKIMQRRRELGEDVPSETTEEDTQEAEAMISGALPVLPEEVDGESGSEGHATADEGMSLSSASPSIAA